MPRAPILACLAALIPAAACAVTPVEAFLSDQGDTYVEVAGGAGVTLRSTAKVDHRVGVAPPPPSVETLTLSDDCSATSTQLGAGEWAQDARGLVVMFTAMALRFPHGPASLGQRCAPGLMGWVEAGGAAFAQVPGATPLTLHAAGPVTYHVGFAGQPLSGPETLRFGPGCAVTSDLVGEGAWMRQPGGWGVSFALEGAGLWFPDQKPPEAAGDC